MYNVNESKLFELDTKKQEKEKAILKIKEDLTTINKEIKQVKEDIIKGVGISDFKKPFKLSTEISVFQKSIETTKIKDYNLLDKLIISYLEEKDLRKDFIDYCEKNNKKIPKFEKNKIIFDSETIIKNEIIFCKPHKLDTSKKDSHLIIFKISLANKLILVHPFVVYRQILAKDSKTTFYLKDMVTTNLIDLNDTNVDNIKHLLKINVKKTLQKSIKDDTLYNTYMLIAKKFKLDSNDLKKSNLEKNINKVEIN